MIKGAFMENKIKRVLDLIKENDIKMVDFKMVDINGQYRHVTIPAGNFSESVLKNGIGFDASNYGYAVVEKSDMVFIPDPDTAAIDPFCQIPTLSMTGNAMIIGNIKGLCYMIILLLGNDDAETLGGAVPIGLLCIDGGADLVSADLPARFIKEVEFKFGKDEHLVRDSALFHLGNSRLDDVSGVLRKRAVFGCVDDHCVTRHRKGGDGTEGVDDRGVGIGDEDHVALLYHGISIVGCIKSDSALHRVLGEVCGGDGYVTVLTVDIDHLEVDHLDTVFFDHSNNIFYVLAHFVPPYF